MPIGEAIIYMITMVAQIGVGIVVGSYLAHHFLVIVELTAAGHDRMTWPKEPYKDWLWKPPYLAWLIAFWLAPAGITLKFVKMPFLADSKWLQFIALALPGLWLFFPITLLSSFSATSRLIIFRPAIVRGLLQFPGKLLGFYLITAALLGVCGASYLWAGASKNFWMMPLSAGIVSAGILIYARLLGRLGWMLQQIKGRALDRPRRKPSRPSGKKRRLTGDLDQYEDRGPWKMPQPGAEEVVKPVVSPWYGQLDSYGFDDYDPEAKKLEEIKKSKVPFDGPAEPYVLSKEEPPPVPARTGESPHADARADLTKPSEYEMRLAAHDPEPDPPKILFVSGVFNFPWYTDCLPIWLFVAGGLVFTQILYSIQQSVAPALQIGQ